MYQFVKNQVENQSKRAGLYLHQSLISRFKPQAHIPSFPLISSMCSIIFSLCMAIASSFSIFSDLPESVEVSSTKLAPDVGVVVDVAAPSEEGEEGVGDG